MASGGGSYCSSSFLFFRISNNRATDSSQSTVSECRSRSNCSSEGEISTLFQSVSLYNCPLNGHTHIKQGIRWLELSQPIASGFRFFLTICSGAACKTQNHQRYDQQQLLLSIDRIHISFLLYHILPISFLLTHRSIWETTGERKSPPPATGKVHLTVIPVQQGHYSWPVRAHIFPGRGLNKNCLIFEESVV